MAKIKTYTSWGGAPDDAPESARLRPVELDLFQDEYELAFRRWRPLATLLGAWGTQAAAAQLAFGTMGGGPVTQTQMAYRSSLRLDPAWQTAAPRSLQLRLCVDTATGPVAPSASATVSLAPVTFTNPSGSASASHVSAVGAVVANSGVALPSADLQADARKHFEGQPFTYPAADWYAALLVPDQQAAASHVTALRITIEYRHV